MSQIFISYSRIDEAVARELSVFLQAQGFQVWWDAELLGSDDFNDVIYAALSKAVAAIVIWSGTSVRSNFVRDEARFALHRNKLVATRMPGLDVETIPFGFQGQHTEDIASRDKIVRALEKLGASREAPTGVAALPADEQAAWARATLTDNPDELIAFMAAHPNGQFSEQAKVRLRELLARTTEGGSGAATSSRVIGKLPALLSGLTFRVPDFLPTASGWWTAIGLTFAYSIVLTLVYGIYYLLNGTNVVLHSSTIEEVRRNALIGHLLWLPAVVIVFVFSWFHFHQLLRQRLLAASVIVGLYCVAFTLTASLASFLSVANTYLDARLDNTVFTPILLFSPTAVAAIYVIWRLVRAR